MGGGLEQIFLAGFREFSKHRRQGSAADVTLDAARRAMRAAYQREIDAIEAHLAGLATVGSVSPYIGLFGTVWGIMNSFIGISKAQTTNLAVVAPGIAEALLATAVGLAAAIPAVMIYNHFAHATRIYLDLVSRTSGVLGRLLSRDLERSRGSALARKAE